VAGDWIKMEKATARKPEVLQLADLLAIHPDHALGLCFRFWSWCDDQMTSGHAPSVTSVTLDSVFGHAGFASALITVGWLRVREGSLEVPNFDRHLSDSAKNRALSGERKKKQRAGVTELSRSNRDKSVTREEKRREEKTEVINTVAIASPRVFQPPSISEVVTFAQTEQLCLDGREFVNFYASKNWMVGKNKMKDWQAAARGWDSRQRKATVNDRREPLSANQRREQTTADAISLLEQQVAAKARAAIAIPFSDD
jgi:hypothetical protein